MPASTILQQKNSEAKMASHILHKINFYLNNPDVTAIPEIDLAGERRERGVLHVYTGKLKGGWVGDYSTRENCMERQIDINSIN